jgi:hypothetical protein
MAILLTQTVLLHKSEIKDTHHLPILRANPAPTHPHCGIRAGGSAMPLVSARYSRAALIKYASFLIIKKDMANTFFLIKKVLICIKRKHHYAVCL